MYTRREFGKLTLAGLALPRLVAAADPVNGVRLGCYALPGLLVRDFGVD